MSDSIVFWDRMAGTYDRQVERVFSQAYQKTIAHTKKYLKETDKVLDIGCGTGITTVAIADFVKTVDALDLSAKMLEAAKRKAFSQRIGNIDFYKKSIFDENLKKENYDVIIAYNVLCYVQEDEDFVKRIHDLLKDGGIFLSVTDCLGEKDTISCKLQRLLGKTGIIPKINQYSISELKNRISHCKFKILESENVHSSPPNYYIAAKKYTGANSRQETSAG